MASAPEPVTVILLNGGSVIVQNVVAIYDADTPWTLLGTPNVGSATVTMLNTAGVFVGQQVFGIGVPFGTFVSTVTANTSITISQNAIAPADGATKRLLSFGGGYYEGDTWRNELDATYIGAAWVTTAAADAIDPDSGGNRYVPNADDSLNVIAPRFLQKCRSRVMFSRQDALGNTLPIRWFWSDSILGLGDGAETF